MPGTRFAPSVDRVWRGCRECAEARRLLSLEVIDYTVVGGELIPFQKL